MKRLLNSLFLGLCILTISSQPAFASNLSGLISAGVDKTLNSDQIEKSKEKDLSEQKQDDDTIEDDQKMIVISANDSVIDSEDEDAKSHAAEFVYNAVLNGETVTDDELAQEMESFLTDQTAYAKNLENGKSSTVSGNVLGGGITGYGENDGTYGGYTNLGLANVDNWLNVRKEASENGEIVGKMPKHAGCEVLEITEDGGWAHIKSGKVEGYCSTDYLITGQEAIDLAPECIKLLATVTTTTLFVRSEPSTEASIVTMVPLEEELEVEEDLDGWVKITIDEDEGYISKDYCHISEKFDSAVTIQELKYGMGVSELRVNMVKYAMKFLGNRYVWGGTSLTNGTDCSGFTMGIYRNFGISLPRVSRSQATVGKKITGGELRPGDLIFYGKGNYINHVAMYIGNGQIIHAANKRSGIKISNAYYRTPVTMRRIISD